MCFFKIYLYIIFALHLILYCPPLLNNGQSNNGARAKGYEARFDSTHNKIGKNNVTLRFSMSTETSQIEILKTDSITLLTYKLSTWIVILSFRTCPCYCFKLNAKTISKICWSPQFWQPGEKWLPTLIIKYICDKDMYTDTHSLSHSPSHPHRPFLPAQMSFAVLSIWEPTCPPPKWYPQYKCTVLQVGHEPCLPRGL